MRTSRCILYTALGTGLCLAYVFLQTEVVKLGYKITETQKVLETCLDMKKALQYSLSSLESPLNIDKSLFLKDNAFEMAKEYRLVKVGFEAFGPSAQAFAPKTVSSVRESAWRRFALLFLFASKPAEAKTVK